MVLVDARSDAEYASGHIPGARSIDWQRNLEDDRSKPLDALRSLYAGLPDAATLVTYCQTGSRAAMAYVVLRHLGHDDVRLYDGSWAEWSQDPARPVETE